ncbi:hypothetical protein K1719_015566 [Acacia pycnantha]|nr:hypothetical protein K1719_015566 [Acacia pycnantha]
MFFREICAFELNVEKLRHLEASMPITLCKLEMVFSSNLFDSMEHLPIHLAYEAKVESLQQYRWMYPFERFLRTLKEKIKNPRYVKGSIAEAFLVEEATKFASYYYPPKMISRWRGARRNDDGSDTSDHISIFNFPSRVMGKHFRSTLEGSDKRVMEWYILNNCEEAALYLKPLHAIAYFLNPKFHYDSKFNPDCEVKTSLWKTLEKMCPDIKTRITIDSQIEKFDRAEGLFGNSLAIATRDRKQHALWWNSFGPRNLQDDRNNKGKGIVIQDNANKIDKRNDNAKKNDTGKGSQIVEQDMGDESDFSNEKGEGLNMPELDVDSDSDNISLDG